MLRKHNEMGFPSREEVRHLRYLYPPGRIVMLAEMYDEPQAPPRGTCGEIRGVDDAGSILKVSFNEAAGDYEITADEVLGGIAPKANKLEQAKQMLREMAETSNMVQSNEIFDMADEQGISKRTLENAKKELGIRAKKINNSWYWELDKVKSD